MCGSFNVLLIEEGSPKLKKDGLLRKLNSMVGHMLDMVFWGIYIVVDIALEAVSIFL